MQGKAGRKMACNYQCLGMESAKSLLPSPSSGLLVSCILGEVPKGSLKSILLHDFELSLPRNLKLGPKSTNNFVAMLPTDPSVVFPPCIHPHMRAHTHAHMDVFIHV